MSTEQSHSLTVCHGHPGDEMSGQPWVVELVLTREPGRNNTDFYYVVRQPGGQLSHYQLSLTCPVGLLHFLITLDWPGVEWSGVWTIFSRAQNKATRRRRGVIMFYPPSWSGLSAIPQSILGCVLHQRNFFKSSKLCVTSSYFSPHLGLTRGVLGTVLMAQLNIWPANLLATKERRRRDKGRGHGAGGR